MDDLRLPTTTRTEQPRRTYLVTGTLGTVLFVASGLLWDTHPFLGSLTLELGGGAFIVFLLAFLLPSILGYAERVRRVTLMWSSAAVEDLFGDYPDEELRVLLESVELGSFPPRPSLRNGVTDTGTRERGHRVLARTWSVGPTAMQYYVRTDRRLQRTVVITNLRRLAGSA